MAEENEKRDPFDGDYIGNPWGWRISLYGLGLIILFSIIAFYRSQRGLPLNPENTEKVVDMDSLLQE